jgi:hypothetical protein
MVASESSRRIETYYRQDNGAYKGKDACLCKSRFNATKYAADRDTHKDDENTNAGYVPPNNPPADSHTEDPNPPSEIKLNE